MREKATARRVIDAARQAEAIGYAGNAPAAEAAEAAAAAMQAAAGTVGKPRNLTETYQRILDRADGTSSEPAGLRLGWYDVDAVTGGMKPGQLILVGGRPAMGKSTVGNNVARAVAWEQGKRALIAGMEMSHDEVWTRLLAEHAGVSLNKLLRLGGHGPDESDWQRLAKAEELIACGRLVVEDQDDRPNMGLADLRAAVRQHRPDVLIVDYLQLLREPAAENRQQAISKIARGLKLIAQLEHLPVVALCQLNRLVEHRADKRPGLTDLRESGSLEQEADVVILVHRPDYYDRESDRPGEAEFIVAKNRNGPTTIVTVAAQLHYARFADMAVA